MSKRYVVAEISEDVDIGEFIRVISKTSQRFAVVNKVNGLFQNSNETEHLHSAAEETSIDCDFPPSNQKGLRVRFGDSFKEGDASSDDQITFSRKRKAKCGGGWKASARKKKTETPAKKKETIYTCGLCSSQLTWKLTYGRSRFRDHVARHLNTPTAQCGLCDFKGILIEHIRRHYSSKHKKITPNIIKLEQSEDYNDRFNELWNVCFPTISLSGPLFTGKKTGANEAELSVNLLDKENCDVSKASMLNPTEETEIVPLSESSVENKSVDNLENTSPPEDIDESKFYDLQ